MTMNNSAVWPPMAFIHCNHGRNLSSLILNSTHCNASVNATNRSIPGSVLYNQIPKQGNADYSQMIARIFYILVLIIGTTGNVLACYIIITRKFMRRIIHIYTFNLAVADLIVMLFYVPVEIVRNENDLQWTMGSAICSLNNFAAPTSIVASICTLVAITLDRHRGVTKPFLWRGDSRKVLKYTIPAIWFTALVSSAPLFFVAKVIHEKTGTYCIEEFPNKTSMKAYWITMFCLQVLVPLCIIVVANTHMIWAMGRLSKLTENVEQHRQHKRMIRMVVLLVLVYAVCSSPQHIVFFWFVYGDLEQRRELSKHVFKAANLLVIVQSAINPIIYGTGRSDFKRAFKAIFYCTKVREYSRTRESKKLTLVPNETKYSQIQNSVFSQATPTTDVSKPYNKTLKFTQCNVTDTPPVDRKYIYKRPQRQSEPMGPKIKDTSTEKVKHFSFPNGRFSSLKNGTREPSKKQSRISEDNKEDDTISIEICVSELKNLMNSPETIL